MRRAAALLTCTVLMGGLAACTSGTGIAGSAVVDTTSTSASSSTGSGAVDTTSGAGPASTATSTDVGSPAQDATMSSMLAMVPASVAGDQPVTINLYWKAAAAGGVTVPDEGATLADQSKYSLALTNSLDTGIGMAGSDLLFQLSQRATADGQPIAASDIAADVQASAPPRIAIAARGSFDTTAIDRAFRDDPTWQDELTTPSYHGHTFYRWLDDLKIDMTKLNTGLFTEVGSSRRMAFPNASTFLFGRDDATMHALLDVAADPAGSLASDARYRQVAAALDEQDVYSAMILGPQPLDPLVAAISKLTPEQAKQVLAEMRQHALKPYLLAGIGEALVQGSPRTVIVLVNSDDDAARANAEALRGLITSGKSLQAQQPWSDFFGIDSVTTDGAVTIGVLTLTDPARVTAWSRAVYNRDTLLAMSN